MWLPDLCSAEFWRYLRQLVLQPAAALFSFRYNHIILIITLISLTSTKNVKIARNRRADGDYIHHYDAIAPFYLYYVICDVRVLCFHAAQKFQCHSVELSLISDKERSDTAISKSLISFLMLTVSAVYNGELVGMGRPVEDGAMYRYLQEIIVLPQFHGCWLMVYAMLSSF